MPTVNAETVIADIQAQAQGRGYTLDEQQQAAVARLGELAAGLSSGWLPRLKKPKSVYIWGPVGRGKSFLLDAFFAALPLTQKRRVHFHAFFRELHQRQFEYALSQQGIENALDEMLKDCELLCFDEFHLHDIGDAMLMSRFFKALFKRDCLLLTTSNYPPEGLLPNPLYHERFLPTIRLIESRMDVLSIAGGIDYRSLATAEPDPFAKGAFLSPANAQQRQALGLPADAPATVRLPVNHRSINVISAEQGTLHLRFVDLCEAATATMDYLALVADYRRWVIEAVPRISTASAAAQQRFLNLVDVLYDNRCEVFINSDWPLKVTVDHCEIADIVRTRSRLSQLRQIINTQAHPETDSYPLSIS